MTPTTPSPISDQARTLAADLWDDSIRCDFEAFKLRVAAALSTAPSTIALEPDAVQHGGKDIMQIWFECNRDVFTFYDRITAPTTGRAPEPIAWYIADDNGEVYATTGYEHERDGWRSVGHVVYDLYAAPASPEASVLTDAELSEIDTAACEWTDDWSERQELAPSKEACNAMFIRRVIALLAASMGGEPK